jgi:hypothetical protein
VAYKKRKHFSRSLRAARESVIDYPVVMPEVRREIIIKDHDFGTVEHHIVCKRAKAY